MPQKIYSRFDRPKTIAAAACPTTEQRYIEKLDADGHKYLAEAEVYPFYDQIQKYKDECDVYAILKRYEAGDEAAISKLAGKGGTYGDFTELPTDLIDLKNKLKSAEALFDNLTIEERKACDNNVDVFLANLGRGELPVSLQKALGVYKEPEVSQSIEQKIETAVESGASTIIDAVNGQGGAV